ncbi:MAG: permease [Acidobacteriota bacterium]
MIRQAWLAGIAGALLAGGDGLMAYENFRTAVYVRAYEVREMADLERLAEEWRHISSQVHVDKIYLETHRDRLLVDADVLEKAKAFFQERGVEVAGGITLTVNERNRFETFCYSNPEHRSQVREIAEFTARHFDEFILDDFFFTNCKCKLCIEAKGARSWTEYRLALLTEAARSLILEPARRVNPRVKVVIKYPNWYEHFQGLGFNLETGPRLFDGIYTGTETRDAVLSAQHLQPYESYLIFRFFENIRPGGNGGGWVDTGGLRHWDRYAEQLWLTIFAKAPEITLFDYRQMKRPLSQLPAPPWKEQPTTFRYGELMQPADAATSERAEPLTAARAAGYALEIADRIAGKLGRPVGLPAYKPLNSLGEDFLHNYLGMIGIPVDLTPYFPAASPTVLLAESAAQDSSLVETIKRQLWDGKRVVITSGLLQALGSAIDDIVELRMSGRKALVQDYVVPWGRLVPGEKPVLIPQIQYLTNDSWEELSAVAGPNGFPLLHSARYAEGTLYVLTVPENFADFYAYPAPVLDRLRQILCADHWVRLEGPSGVSLFLYDNRTGIVESFQDEPVSIKLVFAEAPGTVVDLVSGRSLPVTERRVPTWGGPPLVQHLVELELAPHSFVAFAAPDPGR